MASERSERRKSCDSWDEITYDDLGTVCEASLIKGAWCNDGFTIREGLMRSLGYVWKTHYFALTDRALYYFSKNAKAPTGRIGLDQIEHIEMDYSGIYYGAVMKLNTTARSRPYKLCSQISSEETELWLADIYSALASLSQKDPLPFDPFEAAEAGNDDDTSSIKKESSSLDKKKNPRVLRRLSSLDGIAQPVMDPFFCEQMEKAFPPEVLARFPPVQSLEQSRQLELDDLIAFDIHPNRDDVNPLLFLPSYVAETMGYIQDQKLYDTQEVLEELLLEPPSNDCAERIAGIMNDCGHESTNTFHKGAYCFMYFALKSSAGTPLYSPPHPTTNPLSICIVFHYDMATCIKRMFCYFYLL